MSSGATRLTDTLHAASHLLEAFGGVARRHWPIAPLALVALLIMVAPWAIVFYGLPALGRAAPWIGGVISAALSVFLALSLILALLAASLWLLWRPRITWLLPDPANASFSGYAPAPETLEAARHVVALLRGTVGGALLLDGPPGVGKGSLAQRISVEAGAPLARLNAASFRAAFPGVDALAVRALYRQARRQARRYGACVVYLDELDALSRARGADALGALLAELDPPPPMNVSWRERALRALGLRDGRQPRPPILTIGATSDPAALAPALTRAGRFDRAITLAPPDEAQRAAIIEHALATVPHEALPLPTLCAELCGYTPSAITRVINEAAALAWGAGHERVTWDDLMAARALHAVSAEAPRALSPVERRRRAYHEAGRAVARALLTPDERVAWASIVLPTEIPPLADEATQSAQEVVARIEVALAGRAAEEIFLGERLTDTSGDLATATRLALGHVARWGMGESLIATPATTPTERLAADSGAREQAERLLRQALGDARALLERRRRAVIAVAEALAERGELAGDDVVRLVAAAETPTPTEMASLTSLAETALFGASAPVDFEPPAERLIGPVALEPTSHTDIPAPTATASATPEPGVALTPTTFAASPSQELRVTGAARAIDRAVLRAPRQRPSQPATSGVTGARDEPGDGARG